MFNFFRLQVIILYVNSYNFKLNTAVFFLLFYILAP